MKQGRLNAGPGYVTVCGIPLIPGADDMWDSDGDGRAGRI